MRKLLKAIAYLFGFLLLFLLLGYLYIQYGLAPHIPEVKDKSALNLQRIKVDSNFYRIGNNWLRKSKSGLWEEYVEGEPFERGVITGKLEKELLYSQEVAFVDQIHNLVPNNSCLPTFHAPVTSCSPILDCHMPMFAARIDAVYRH